MVIIKVIPFVFKFDNAFTFHIMTIEAWAIHDRYSPNIKEIKVLDKKKVRRAKLYYLRDKMNALKKQ